MTTPTKSSLEGWNRLTEEVQVPQDVGAAIFTGRPELLKAMPARALTVDETKGVFHALGVLIETNHELQRHARELAAKVTNLHGTIKGLSRAIDKLEAFANFESEEDVNDE